MRLIRLFGRLKTSINTFYVFSKVGQFIKEKLVRDKKLRS